MNIPIKRPANATEALKKLRDGNVRFTSGMKSVDSILGIHKLKELAENGQQPYCIVVCCSDSRGPVETIFDCGLGEIFVVRIAGNVISPGVIASLEFAAQSFSPHLLVVMGHTRCGAITAAVEAETGKPEPTTPSLEHLLREIRPSVREAIERNPDSSKEQLKIFASEENVRHGLKLITELSPLMKKLVKSSEIALQGAMYDLSNGEVSFLDDRSSQTELSLRKSMA